MRKIMFAWLFGVFKLYNFDSCTRILFKFQICCSAHRHTSNKIIIHHPNQQTMHLRHDIKTTNVISNHMRWVSRLTRCLTAAHTKVTNEQHPAHLFCCFIFRSCKYTKEITRRQSSNQWTLPWSASSSSFEHVNTFHEGLQSMTNRCTCLTFAILENLKPLNLKFENSVFWLLRIFLSRLSNYLWLSMNLSGLLSWR